MGANPRLRRGSGFAFIRGNHPQTTWSVHERSDPVIGISANEENVFLVAVVQSRESAGETDNELFHTSPLAADQSRLNRYLEVVSHSTLRTLDS
jgi:hypothetical protein